MRNALILSGILLILTGAFMWGCNLMLVNFFERVKHGEAELELQARERKKEKQVEIEAAEECIA